MLGSLTRRYGHSHTRCGCARLRGAQQAPAAGLRLLSALCRTALAAVLAAAVFNAVAAPATAQQKSVLGFQEPGPNAPMHLNADRLDYSRSGRTAIASGNVEIQYGVYTVFADKVTYNRDTGALTATGHVRFIDPKGHVIEAEHVELSDKFREGFVRQLTLLMANEARLNARSAERHEGNILILNDATYTRCKACAEHPERPLVWQIKARRVIHDKEEKTIYYEDASLEFLGIPLFYLPKFNHPDPTVRRKSGFLVPTFVGSSEFGVGVEVPYFFNLAPNYDFTFQPILTSEQGPVLKGEWRHRVWNGEYSVTPTGVYQLNERAPPGDTRFRGSIETKGKFDITNHWRWGWDATVTSDDTFTRTYKVKDDTDLVSQAYLTGLSDQNYFDARAYHFRGLLATDNNSATPYVLPDINHNYVFRDGVTGGQVSLRNSFFSLHRTEGADSTRAISEVSWKRQMIGSLGQVITPFAHLRGDFYVVDDIRDPTVAGGKRNQETAARVVPVAGVDVRMPFVQSSLGGSHVLEPVAQLIVRPNETKVGTISNEDSASFEFDDVNLFSISKFSGLDRYEGGVRGNVGVNYTYTLNSGPSARFSAGESFQIAGRNSYGAGTGLDRDSSDFVGSIYVLLNEHLSASARLRLDEQTLNVRRSEIGGRAKYGPVTAIINYTEQDPIPAFGLLTQEEEIVANASFQLTDRWLVYGGVRYDIARDRTTTDKVGFGYDDECFGFVMQYSESFADDRDLDPERAVMMRFNLKTIGSAGISSGIN